MGSTTVDSALAKLQPTRRLVGLAIGGPAAFGVAFALQQGLVAGLGQGLFLHAVIIGLAALLGPALYIVAAWIGAAPPGRAFVVEWGRAVADVARILLALAPATAFLVASAQGAATGVALGALGLAMAMFFVLWRLHGSLFAQARPAMHALYVLWAGVGLGIGARVYLQFIAGVQL